MGRRGDIQEKVTIIWSKIQIWASFRDSYNSNYSWILSSGFAQEVQELAEYLSDHLEVWLYKSGSHSTVKSVKMFRVEV
jgi:hypothetical protein